MNQKLYKEPVLCLYKVRSNNVLTAACVPCAIGFGFLTLEAFKVVSDDKTVAEVLLLSSYVLSEIDILACDDMIFLRWIGLLLQLLSFCIRYTLVVLLFLHGQPRFQIWSRAFGVGHACVRFFRFSALPPFSDFSEKAHHNAIQTLFGLHNTSCLLSSSRKECHAHFTLCDAHTQSTPSPWRSSSLQVASCKMSIVGWLTAVQMSPGLRSARPPDHVNDVSPSTNKILDTSTKTRNHSNDGTMTIDDHGRSETFMRFMFWMKPPWEN